MHMCTPYSVCMFVHSPELCMLSLVFALIEIKEKLIRTTQTLEVQQQLQQQQQPPTTTIYKNKC